LGEEKMDKELGAGFLVTIEKALPTIDLARGD
jgi:hypothetical protein